jgi:hypothetical protein
VSVAPSEQKPAELHLVEIRRNQEAWERKPLLRVVYGQFYARIRENLAPVPGLIVEVGSGIGAAKAFIPECITTDIFHNPWIDRRENAYSLSFRTGTVSNLILLDVFHHLQFPGTALSEFWRDSFSQDTRSLVLEVKVADPQHRLRPGMFASVQLRFNAPEPGILISGDSVIAQARGEFVPIVQNAVIHMQPVLLGRDLGSQIYVASGLEDGDLVVVSPTYQVKEGVRVSMQPAPKGQQ